VPGVVNLGVFLGLAEIAENGQKMWEILAAPWVLGQNLVVFGPF
jgi:hypothetical protein